MAASYAPPTVEKWDEEGTEELDETAGEEEEEGGLVLLAAPMEEGARLGSAAEEWYAGSGSATERGPPSESLQEDGREKTNVKG